MRDINMLFINFLKLFKVLFKDLGALLDFFNTPSGLSTVQGILKITE